MILALWRLNAGKLLSHCGASSDRARIRFLSHTFPEAALIGEDHMNASASKKRILILGRGLGGVYTARHLERLVKN